MNIRDQSAVLERGRLPLYVQVTGLLRRRLEAGEWRVGDQIPTIDDLMEEYRVSRVTMRQALLQLENEGLVKRGQGRGTFVTGDATAERWLILPTEWHSLVSHIGELNARVVELESGARAPVLDATDGVLAEAYWHVKRINYTAQAAYSLTSIYLSRDVYRKNAAEYSNGAILPLLARHAKDLIVEASQTLTVSTADVDTARYLQLDVGTPIAEVRRVVRDRRDRVIYLADVLYPSRHLKIQTLLFSKPSRSTKRNESKK